MSDLSKIQWTDATWPCVRGCSKVSPGCAHCWAIRDAHLHAGAKNPKAAAHFKGLTVVDNGAPNWSGVVRLDESILLWPLKWRKPREIFAASSGDLFHEKLPDEEIDKVFAVMLCALRHKFQILTKRPARMLRYFRDGAARRGGWGRALLDTRLFPDDPRRSVLGCPKGSPSRAGIAEGLFSGWRSLILPNVALGVSIENPATAVRIFDLRDTPAALRFVSYEPALEAVVDFRPYLKGIDWLILGGESGPGARPASLSWFRDAIRAARQAGTKVFMKQLGARPEGETSPESAALAARPLADRACTSWEYWPADLRPPSNL